MGEKSEVLIKIFGVFDITGEVLTMFVILALTAVLSIIATRHLKMRPGKF